jgi:hypothetical protein
MVGADVDEAGTVVAVAGGELGGGKGRGELISLKMEPGG